MSKHQPCHCCDIVLFIPRRVASPSRYLEITDGSLEVFDINIVGISRVVLKFVGGGFGSPEKATDVKQGNPPRAPGGGGGRWRRFR